MKKPHVLIGITGSIAAYKAYEVIRTLQKRGATVKCVASKGGMEFINRLTVETLLQDSLYHDAFALSTEKKATHIPLADWADIIAVVPASANVLARVAAGMADDLLTSIILATRAKILFAPAMHTNMWLHPMTQRNVETLTRCGYCFVGPETGALSDGTKGVGHIASLDAMVAAIMKLVPSSRRRRS